VTADRTVPRDPGNHRLARAVLVLGIALGVVYLAYKASVMPEKAATDFDVYRSAATELWAGREVYGYSSVGVEGLSYRYPPIFLAWFALYPLVPPLAGLAIHVGGLLAASVVLGVAIAREIRRHGVALSRVDAALIVACVAVCPFAAASLFFVNVNHVLAMAVGVGLIALGRDREWRAGVGVGFGALLKIFPAGIGVWLLHRRAWRATAAATATGVGGLLAGLLVFGPARTITFLTEEMVPRAAPGAEGTIPPESIYVTLRRPLSLAFPDVGGFGLTLLAVAVLAPVVGYCYWRADGPTDRLLALFATLAALLLAVPSYSNYFVILLYPMIPLLYLLDGPLRIAFAAGAGLSLVTAKL